MNMTNKITEQIKKETDNVYKEAVNMFEDNAMKEELAKQ